MLEMKNYLNWCVIRPMFQQGDTRLSLINHHYRSVLHSVGWHLKNPQCLRDFRFLLLLFLFDWLKSDKHSEGTGIRETAKATLTWLRSRYNPRIAFLPASRAGRAKSTSIYITVTGLDQQARSLAVSNEPYHYLPSLFTLHADEHWF